MAVLAAAAALIGTLQVAQPTPAQALPPDCNMDLFSAWDTSGHCFDELLAELLGTGGLIIPFRPNMPPRPPEAPPEPVLMLNAMERAKRDALEKLRNPNGNCRRLITGTNPAKGNNAITVLENIDIIFEASKPQREVLGKPVYAEPSAQGDSTFGFIRVYQVFQGLIKFSDVRAKFGPPPQPYRGPDSDEIRVAILLHELAHLTGALNHTETEQTPKFDTDILLLCLELGYTRPPRG